MYDFEIQTSWEAAKNDYVCFWCTKNIGKFGIDWDVEPCASDNSFFAEMLIFKFIDYNSYILFKLTWC